MSVPAHSIIVQNQLTEVQESWLEATAEWYQKVVRCWIK